MELHEEVDIVIVGAGLAGLTTALALHRGVCILAWIYLKLGKVICQLELTAYLSSYTKLLKLVNCRAKELDKDGKFEGYESRGVKRKDLLEALLKELPQGTIRYSSKVATIDELDWFKLVHLADGSILKTKVLVGCDGVNLVVAKWFGFRPTGSVCRLAIRGFGGFKWIGFCLCVIVIFGGGIRFGFLPVDDKTVYWFCTFTPSEVPTYEEDWQENPSKMKQFVLSRINKMPQEAQDVVEKTSLSNISYATLKFRLPWNVLLGNIVKGNVCVAGDALHPMTPDIGQGGCSSLEDSVVLGRCLGEAFLKKSNENDELRNIKKGLEENNERLGLRSLVLESSESLRVTGFALTLWTNAWKALDVVGIGDTLRQKSTQITGMKMVSPDTGLFTSGQPLDKDGK
ncbi:FAD/NAD(P)-binding oxidoreductase family protein [Tanacetum coccineum]